MTNRNITISDNVMHDLALDHRDMTAVLVTYATDVTVSHNEIHDMPYTGIAIGTAGAPTTPEAVRTTSTAASTTSSPSTPPPPR
ncbi:hypothetical protein [Streptomyces sp. NPDC051572]|uniref:hypothetical protein n=1 Tax=unclassified Streptomyces TaxID=2593676 RepID=UPI00344D6166